MYRRDIHVKWQFYLNIWWVILSSNYHTTLLVLLKAANKRYMVALSDDTKTKFIGKIDFELYAVWWTYCLKSTGRSYTFLVMHFWWNKYPTFNNRWQNIWKKFRKILQTVFSPEKIVPFLWKILKTPKKLILLMYVCNNSLHIIVGWLDGLNHRTFYGWHDKETYVKSVADKVMNDEEWRRHNLYFRITWD